MSWTNPWTGEAELPPSHPRSQARNDTPPPPRLTLIRDAGHPIEHLPDLAAAAARLCALRPRGAGLQLTRSFACFSGSATFEAVSVSVLVPGNAMPDYVARLALPHAELPALQAAVKAHAGELRSRRKAA